jgi:hypothetical protein
MYVPVYTYVCIGVQQNVKNVHFRKPQKNPKLKSEISQAQDKNLKKWPDQTVGMVLEFSLLHALFLVP